MKKTLAMMLLLSVILVSACNAGQDNIVNGTAEVIPTNTQAVEILATETAVPTEIKEDITVSVLLIDYISGETDVWIEEILIPGLKERTPNITFDVTYASFDVYQDEIDRLRENGSNFDVIQFKAGYDNDVGDHMNPVDWIADHQFMDAALENVTLEDEIYGVPIYADPSSLYCRSDLLKEKGIDQNPENFEEVIEINKEATLVNYLEELIQYGFVSDGGLYSFEEFLSFMMAADISLFDNAGKLELDDQNIKPILEFFYDRYHAADLISAMDLIPVQGQNILESGKVFCSWGFLDSLPDAGNEIWENINISAGVPHSDIEPGILLKTGWLGVPGNSENPEAAFEFIEYFSVSDHLYEYNLQLGTIPPTTGAWGGIYSEGFYQQLTASMVDHGVGMPGIPGYDSLREIFFIEVDKYFQGKQDLDTTIEKIQHSYNQSN